MTSPHPTHALVVGAGIGGLAAALALARKGVDSVVLEQAEELREIGAGIQLAPNALRVLDRLGVLDEVLATSVHPARAVMRSAVTGDEIVAIDFDETFRLAFGYPYVVTHRSDLHAALLDACRAEPSVSIHTGHRVVGVEEHGDGARVTTETGAAFSARLVIGADGLHSAVRRFVLDASPPVCAGDVAYRGTVPRPSEGPDAVDLTWWVGPRMHLIQYPVRNGKVLNQVAVFTSTAYPGTTAEDEWGGPEELDESFGDKFAAVREGAALIDRSRHWKLYDRDPDDAWTRGAVTLLGDAAHPMLQYLAQGGCQALEDALVLAECVAERPGDITGALGRYQDERLPRTARVQRSARAMGDIVHGDGVTSALRDELLGQLSPSDFRYVDWLYSYDYPRPNGVGR
ncbi:FAD-dependent monooxygenase [Microbacterium sp. RD1]|uniref:FAD-dependent monooxygenase n=1 Tax=Microbacterium sp. RD1 TaxID=3457313 RepID=UPI003FA5B541